MLIEKIAEFARRVAQECAAKANLDYTESTYAKARNMGALSIKNKVALEDLENGVAESLRGQKGDPGPKGEPGPKGDPGPKGEASSVLIKRW